MFLSAMLNYGYHSASATMLYESISPLFLESKIQRIIKADMKVKDFLLSNFLKFDRYHL